MRGRRPGTGSGLVALSLGVLLVLGVGAPPASAASRERVAASQGAAVGQSAVRAPAPTQRTMTFGELLDATPKAPPLYVGYTGAEQFIPRAVAMKKDARGCVLRQQMLIAMATIRPKVGKGCRMTGGTWTIDFGTRTVKSPKGISVLPVVPYKRAWGQGAYAWTPAQRLAFATNVGTGPSLRGKSVPVGVTQTLVSSQVLGAVKNDLDIAQCKINVVACALGVAAGTVNAAVNAVSASEACRDLARYVGALNSWGLSVSPDLAGALNTIRDRCAQRYLIFGFSNVYGIIPVQPTSAVPANAVYSTDPILDGYVPPVTDPVTGLFGLMAPWAWGAPPKGTVPVQALRLWDSSVSWADLQPGVVDAGSSVPKRGPIDFTRMDAAIARATALGARVVYVLGNTPAWANGGNPGNVPPTNLQDAADFVRALCMKYQGQIAEYEVWNEGNIETFWTGTPEQLADLTGRIKDVVRGCFPSAKVIASSAGARAEGGFARRYDPYLKALKEKNWPVDAFAIHSYPKADGGPMERVGLIQQWKAMLSANGAPIDPAQAGARALYDSELNYGLGGLGQDRVVIDDAKGAAYMLQSFIQSVQYGIDSVDWFIWSADRQDDKVGIQFNDVTIKQQQAWKAAYDWLNGSRMQRCVVQDGEQHACAITLADGGNATLLWSTGDGQWVTVKGLGQTICTVDAPCIPFAGQRIFVGSMPIMVRQ